MRNEVETRPRSLSNAHQSSSVLGAPLCLAHAQTAFDAGEPDETTNDHARAPTDHGKSAGIEPPITEISLSTLDRERIMSDARLRHHLCLDSHVTFQSYHGGSIGARKKAYAAKYWPAVAIELQFYLDEERDTKAESSDNPLNIPSRLRRVFETIREIIKTLVSRAKWSAIEARLDVGLLMQELKHGACDVVALGEWLGTLLQTSCSPSRDPLVTATIVSIQNAARKNDSQDLAGGIEGLFSVLETMKLDMANYQVKFLRHFLVSESVDFLQSYFLGMIANGMEVWRAWKWYDAAVARQGDEGAPIGNYVHFTKILPQNIINLVIGNVPFFPSTFEFDHHRLRALQIEFTDCVLQVRCVNIWQDILRRLGCPCRSSPLACSQLLRRILQIRGSPWARDDEPPSNRNERTAIAIVQDAYMLSGIEGLPTDSLVSAAITSLDELDREPHSQRDSLEDRLHGMVADEIAQIGDLTPLQMLHHYNSAQIPSALPHPLFSPSSPTPAVPSPASSPSSRLNSEWHPPRLRYISQRIAHITVLHWRTWGPILYQLPWETIAAGSRELRS